MVAICGIMSRKMTGTVVVVSDTSLQSQPVSSLQSDEQ